MMFDANANPSTESMFDALTVATESFMPQEKSAAVHWTDNLSAQDKSLIGKTFREVCRFINDNTLYGKGTPVADNLFSTGAGNESLNPSVNVVNNIGVSKLSDLCKSCGIRPQDQRNAVMALGNLLVKMTAANENMALYRDKHFSNASDSVAGKSMRLVDLREMLPSSLHGEFLNQTAGMEAFGAEIDRVLPDIRVSMAVTLLKFHRGILDRIMHRRTSPSTIIKYVIPYAEVYDLMKSMDQSAAVRNGKVHRVPFINLYADPKVVSNTLRPIVVLKANDTADTVLRDGVLKPNCKANVMDLSRVAGQIGNNHTDYTDIIADGVILDKVYVQLSKVIGSDTVVEEFELVTRSFSKARLQMQANTLDSADRATIFNQFFKFNETKKTTAGADSVILAGLTSSDCIEIEVNIAPTINLKWHDVASSATLFVRPYSATGAAPAAAVTTALTGLEATMVGFTLDAKYSEENLRKSNVAIRSHYRTMDWEIPVGRNFIVDYAMNESLPEYIMANVTEAISLGQDHRAIDMIMKTMMDVYDRGREENADPNFREDLYKLGFDYVASQQVRPTVYLGAIDLEEVDTIRSSDILGDIRQYVELQLINILSLLHQNSYYKTQLNAGEKPVYKLVTSNIILENLLNVPHIHNHLQAAAQDASDTDTVEYRRVLPSGVVLECVTTTFDYLRDKIIIIPFRANDPESVLNAGHNWDYGTYLAHYNPQIANGVNKRVFANAREMPLMTNPIGLIMEVRNIAKVIDLFQLVDPRGTSGLDIPNITSKLPDTSALAAPGNKTW